MGFARGSLTLPRMNAHRLVIVAAALTTAVAAALATTLASFSGQALSRAVRHDVGAASGTALVISGNVDAAQAAQFTSMLPRRISVALAGAPFAFYHADRSDPLGFVPGSLPAAPASRGNRPIAEAAALGGITGQAVLVSGRWPGGPASGRLQGVIPAALPAAAAALLHVAAGDVLRMQDRISGRDIRFLVTGLYRPRQVSSPYWDLNDIALSGSSTSSGFTTYGPLTVQAAVFAGPLAVNAGSWLAQPRPAGIPAGRLRAIAASVTGLQQALASAEVLPDLTLTTGLPAVLDGTASALDVARSLLAICAVLLSLIVAAALLAVARLLAGQREGESAMLAARGATRWQQLGLTAAEAIPLCLLSAAAGGAAGVLLAGLLASGSAVPAAFGDAWPAAAAVGAAAAVLMLVPSLGALAPGAARVRRGRQAAVSGATRAGADLALVALAVLAGWQLRRYSAATAGAHGIDPVIVAAPALALAGGTVAALRLLPVGARAGDRLAARSRRLNAAMSCWQVSRQPIRQGGAALLIVLAVATGTLALAQRLSWERSADDQAAFGAGADVRVQTSQPLPAAQAAALARTPGVRHAMPVSVFSQATGSETLALDARQAAGVVLLRADQSPLPKAGLFRAILPGGPPPGIGIPGRPAEVRLIASLAAASPGLAPAIVSVSVTDADGDAYQLGAGSLPADGKEHALTASLAGGAPYPLRLIAITVDYTLPGAGPRGPAVFTLAGVSGGPGTATLAGAALRGWAASATSPELAGAIQTVGAAGPSGLPALSATAARGAGLAVTFDPGYGIAAGGLPGAPPTLLSGQLALSARPPVTVLPGLATQGFLAAASARVGSVVQADINGAVIGVRIVAAVASFPTVAAPGGALVVDLPALQNILAGFSLPPAQATQWWLATARGQPGVPPGLAAAVPPGSAVTSAAGAAAGLLGDPLSTVPQRALLVLAVAAAVLAVTGFCASIAAAIRQRRAESGLLAALGVAPRAAAGQLCLEKLMLSLPAAAAGLALGALLAELLVPAITLAPSGTMPVPPLLIYFGWSWAVPLALAVAVVPALAAALTIARRPDAAAELRTAETA
ncbi:MAG: hypothetical protein JO132_15805 [Streptosporangiaceae bacterium]|nr:hypothetical protein [Streptosporangiaceae bacterium]